MFDRLNPSSIHPPFARYAHGVVVEAGARMVFCSGQLGIGPDATIPADVEAQAALCFEAIAAILGEATAFLQDNMEVIVDLVEGDPVAIHLPVSVVLEIVEADPVVKGQTATSSYKPARLSNGVKTMVPPFIETGERIVVRTEDASYVERAKG